MATTSLKGPGNAQAKPTTTAAPAAGPAPAVASAPAFEYGDIDEGQLEASERAAEARAAEQNRGAGGGQSTWLEGTPLLKNTEGVHFFRPIPFPGEANLIEEVDAEGHPTGRKVGRWSMKYTVYRVVDKSSNQDSGPIVCRPKENLLKAARIALFTNPDALAKLKASSFEIRGSERVVFVVLPFNGRTLEDALLLDLPLSRPKNPKKPNDTPKRQVGDDLLGMPKAREDDPIALSQLPDGAIPPLKYGTVFSLEKGRLIALNVAGKRENMVRTVEAKSVYPLRVNGVIQPQFVPLLQGAVEKFGKVPLEQLLRYSTTEDQINWVQMLAPADLAPIALKAMGVKDVPVAAATAAKAVANPTVTTGQEAPAPDEVPGEAY